MILLISGKNVYATERLVEEAQKAGVGIEVMDMADLVARNFKIDLEKYDVFFVRQPYLEGSPKYIPDIISLAKKFKALGKRVVDAVIAEGELGAGKWEDYQKLMKANLPIPATQLLPGYPLPTTNYPLILKWIYGFKARGVFLVKNATDVSQVTSKIPANELMVQEFIEAEYEYKIMTVGYKALPVILKVPIDKKTWKPDFGQAETLQWRHPERSEGSLNEAVIRVMELAEHASKALNRELSKVDILESKGKFYILEVNRWPGLDSFEEFTKFNVAAEFIKYLS